jgi:hypothetical protein
VCPDGLVKTIASDNKSSSAQVTLESAVRTLRFYILFNNVSITWCYRAVPCNIFFNVENKGSSSTNDKW